MQAEGELSVSLGVLYELGSLIFAENSVQAIPVRVKILFDRLLTQVETDEALKLLNSFGWSLQDYARGYILVVGVEQN
jgi:hypothetical protein